jgi:hypothetical protein
MSDDLKLPGEDDKKKWYSGVTTTRIVLWVVVGGFAIYLIVTGIYGILTKAQ